MSSLGGTKNLGPNLTLWGNLSGGPAQAVPIPITDLQAYFGAGSAGTMWLYRANASATSGYPGDGYVLWDNASQIAAANLVFSHLTRDGVDIDVLWKTVTAGRKLILQDVNNSGNYQEFTIGSPAQTIGGGGATNYWTVPVTLVASGGTGTTGFPNNHNLTVFISSSGGGASGSFSMPPFILVSDGNDGEDAIPIPGPRGLTGATGPMGPQAAPGPDGEQGEEGPPLPGALGPRGAQGAQGWPGIDGEAGEETPPLPGALGPQGAAGAAGAAGAPGSDGEPGEDGVPGLPGALGPQGAQGPIGITGASGLDGVDGEDGIPVPGPRGLTGATGPMGPQAMPGLDGEPGEDALPIPGANGHGSTTLIATIPLVAPPIPVKVADSTSFPVGSYFYVTDSTGTNTLTAQVSAAPDINTIQFILALLTTGDFTLIPVGSPVTFSGKPGAVGPMGPQAMPGLDGDEGEAGIPVPGPRGLTGATGPMGPQAMPGLDGDEGEAGIPVPGPRGLTGQTGPMGPQAMPGLDGDEGEPGIPGYVALQLTNVGGAPNSAGASLNGQVFTLQPADPNNPGVVTAGAQTFGGDKTFDNVLMKNASLKINNIGTVGASASLNFSVGAVNQITLTAATACKLNKAAGGDPPQNSLVVLRVQEPATPTGTLDWTGSFSPNSGSMGVMPQPTQLANAVTNLTFWFDSSGYWLIDCTSAFINFNAVGNTPSNQGASVIGANQAITLQPADATHPGLMTAIAQTLGGQKLFAGQVIFGAGALGGFPPGPDGEPGEDSTPMAQSGPPPSGNLIGVSYVTAVLTTTFTTSPQTHTIMVELLGAGGGGGGTTTAASSCSLGGGGAAGGYARKTFAVNPNTAYTIAIGVGGSGGDTTGTSTSNGSAGGNTTFTVGGTTVTANGGAGGSFLAAGTAVGFVNAVAGGSSSNGDLNATGADSNYGHRLSGTGGISGQGASSAFGSGGIARNSNGAGNNAAGFGSGGGGANVVSGGAANSGGAGSGGMIAVWEYT